MRRTRIELLSSGDIDMYDDVSAPLTYSIADIRNPDKRNTSFSKTIKVPGTKGNNIRFGHIFDVNIFDGTFNPNIKAPCTLYIDDIPQISGHLQILNINVLENKIEYELAITGKTAAIFTDLGTQELSDLDLSEGDHVFSKANIKASYTHTYQDLYCYPLIDYGFDGNISKYDVEDFYPAIFAKTYIDKIFSAAGYTYSSNFFNSDRFKKLIIPYNGARIKYTDAQITPRLYSATSSGTILSSNVAGYKTITIDSIVSDPGSQVNLALDRITITNPGYYNINAVLNLHSSGTTLSSSTGLQTQYHMFKNGSPFVSSYNLVFTTPDRDISVSASNVYLNTGDYLEFKLRCPFVINANWIINSGTFTNTVTNNGLLENDTLPLNNAIPQKVKQKDFLMSIIKAFNLFVEVDNFNPKNLFIETRNDFYSSGTTIDWSDKLDVSRNLEIKPMGDLEFKDFKYSYADDKDYYNDKYLKSWQRGYGNRLYETNNEFLQSVNETKLIFSPTPLVADNGDDRIISRIWDVDKNNVVTPKAFGLRLLYNGGVKTTKNDITFTGRVSGTSTESTYLYAGHLDNPTNPTFDLCFAVPFEVYYNATVYTNANLFNEYYKQYIDEITDKDSKIITGYFYLTPKDISILDFRNKFFFNNQIFRLNKIYDYDPVIQQTTKCEFIKLKDGSTFNRTNALIYGGAGEVIDTIDNDNPEEKPLLPASNGNKSTIINPSVLNLGNGNIVDAETTDTIILGDQNNVSQGHNVVILNSSGTVVDAGLTNVFVLNSSGTHVTESNTLIINDIQYSFVIGGSGTANHYAKWTPDGSTLGDGLIRDDENTVYITGVDSSAGTYSFNINNSVGDILMKVRNDGITFFGNSASFWAPGVIRLWGNQAASSDVLTIQNYDQTSSIFEFRQAGNSALVYMKNSLNVITNLIHTAGDSYFNGGNIGIGTTTPDPSALLDVQSTTKGIGFPEMTTAQRDAISSPRRGLVIYNTTTNKLNVYTTAWEAITSV